MPLFRRRHGRELPDVELLESSGKDAGVHARAVDGNAEAIVEDDAHFAASGTAVVALVHELTVDLGRTLIAGIGFLLHARIEFRREPGESRQGPEVGDLDLNAGVRTVAVARSRTRALDAHGFAALAGRLRAPQPADRFGQQVLQTVKIDRLNILAAGHDLSDRVERGIHVDRRAGWRARVFR